MVSIRDLHNNAVGKQGGLALIKVGQIAPGKDSEKAIVENFPAGKYSKDPAEKGQYRPAYKVFICDEHNEGKTYRHRCILMSLVGGEKFSFD